MRRRRLPLAALLAGLLATTLAAPPRAGAQTDEELLRRLETSAEVSWHAPAIATDPVDVRLLGINDLHGELVTRSRELAGGASRPVGGAAVLGAYIAAERRLDPKHTLLLIAGDSVGGSAGVSGLLRDEPTMAVLNELAAGECPLLTPLWSQAVDPVTTRCHVLATLGNHEFDRGTAELERLLYGGKHPQGRVLGHDWRGTKIPFIAANVVRRDGQVRLLPASAIVDLGDVRIGVIGAVTAETPGLVMAGRIADLNILAEPAVINAEVAKLKAAGINTIVLLIHEGLQAPVTAQRLVPLELDEVQGRLASVLGALDGGIDAVIAGHTHKLNNLLVRLRDHRTVLVVQARSEGTAYSSTTLTIDRKTGAVVAKAARVVTPWADSGPGLAPVRSIGRIVAEAAKGTAAIEARPLGVAAAAIRRAESPSGESALGDLVADAQRAAAGTDFAFMNAGGLRSDLEAGTVTFGSIYAVQPFGNTLLRLTLTGEQVLRLLEQQWSGPHAASPRFLRPAGLRYVYDLRRPPGRRVVAASDADGRPLDPTRRYSVAANDFIVSGGDFYPVLAEAPDATPVMTDIAALEAWIKGAPGPLHGALDGRMERLDAPRH